MRVEPMRRRGRPSGTAGRPAWAGVGSAAGAKLIAMGISGVLGIITSSLILSHFGVEAFAQYGLLATLPSLLPFADLGIGAVVINAVAQSRDVRNDELMTRTITSALRVLVMSGVVIAGIAVALLLLGWWPALLGEGLSSDSGPLAATLGLGIFGLTLPVTVGIPILVGLGRTSTQVAAQALAAPFTLAGVALCAFFALPAGGYLAVLPYLGTSLVSAVCLYLAARGIRPQLGIAVSRVARPRSNPGVPVMGIALPMLIQMIALPVAIQTDRILISHLADSENLAEYNLAAQFFGIALQIVAAAGLALWPIFARARSDGTIRSPLAPAGVFLLGGIACGTLIAVLSPWLGGLISGGKVVLDVGLVIWFAVFVALQAVKYPIGMYMTDRSGLRFQVIPTVAMIPVSIGLSLWLIPLWGPSGAVAGSAFAVGLLQVLPYALYVRRDLRRRREVATTAAVDVDEQEPQH